MATSTEPEWPLLPHETSSRPLREFRWDAGLTMEQCATALNMPLLDYSDVEQGRRTLTRPQREQLHSLLTAKVVPGLQEDANPPSATPRDSIAPPPFPKHDFVQATHSAEAASDR